MPTDDEESFIAEIRARPEDDFARLVYADFLEESGNPRGELIRVQCELATLEVGHPNGVSLVERERELLDEWSEPWLEPLRELGAEGVSSRCFRKGLVERIRIDAQRFVANGAELCRIEPALHCLDLRGVVDAADELAEAEWPEQIVELELVANRLEAEHVETLFGFEGRERIRSLDLQFNRLRDDGVATLCEFEWPALERLSLGSNRIGPEGARALSGWASLRHVRSLSLAVNAIGSPGLRHLARSRFAERIEHLDLTSNGIDAEGVRELATGSSLGDDVQGLILRNNRLGEEGLRALLGVGRGGRLRELDVRNVAGPVHYYERRSDDVRGAVADLRHRFGDAMICDFPPPEGS